MRANSFYCYRICFTISILVRMDSRLSTAMLIDLERTGHHGLFKNDFATTHGLNLCCTDFTDNQRLALVDDNNLAASQLSLLRPHFGQLPACLDVWFWVSSRYEHPHCLVDLVRFDGYRRMFHRNNCRHLSAPTLGIKYVCQMIRMVISFCQ